MAVICTMTTVSFANETVVEACTQQLEGQNCSYSIAGSFVRHGVCQKIGPRNHSLLACLRSGPSDPTCSRGLFHTASRACCASHCSFCTQLQQLQQLQGEDELDHACSVDHILRLSPSCSQTGAPCVVQNVFAGTNIEKRNKLESKLVQQLETEETPVASNSEASVVSNLILPLMAGFILSGCSLTVLCYIAHMIKQRTSQTPLASPLPTSPTTKSCVGPGPKGSGSKGKDRGKDRSKGSKGSSKEQEKMEKERTQRTEKFELSDVKVTKATKAPTETDDLGELPDAWNSKRCK